MEMKVNKNEAVLEVALEGRLDANTAPEFTEVIQKEEFRELIVDLEKLEYISSAGLRSLLVGKKTADACQGKMIIRKPSPAVFDVMSMSGFTKILNIQED